MAIRNISVLADDLQLPPRDALRTIARLGAGGVQLYATRGELAAERLSRSARRDLARYIRDLGLTWTAICGDMGGGRLADPARVEQCLERTREVLEMARQVGVPVVTAHAGPIPADENDPTRRQIEQAVREIGDFADRVGVIYALETGMESAATLAEVIGPLDNPALGVNYDAANLILRGDDPVAGVEPLAGRIVYVHAKDAVAGGEGGGRIVPLGEGQLDYPALLGALEDAGYDGTHCIESRAPDRVADAAAAVAFLKRF
jgi:sugar phosphate isomerase/epimerase